MRTPTHAAGAAIEQGHGICSVMYKFGSFFHYALRTYWRHSLGVVRIQVSNCLTQRLHIKIVCYSCQHWVVELLQYGVHQRRQGDEV